MERRHNSTANRPRAKEQMKIKTERERDKLTGISVLEPLFVQEIVLLREVGITNCEDIVHPYNFSASVESVEYVSMYVCVCVCVCVCLQLDL